MGLKRELAIRVQFLLYLVISSIAAIVNLLVGFSLYALLGLSVGYLYALSVAIGYLAGMVVNWSLNRVVTFPASGRRKLSEVRTFVVVALIGLLLTVALAAGFRSTLAPHIAELVVRAGWLPAPSAETTAQVMAVAMVGVYSFLGHKWLTFSDGIRLQVLRLGRFVLRKVDFERDPRTLPSLFDSSSNLPTRGTLIDAQSDRSRHP